MLFSIFLLFMFLILYTSGLQYAGLACTSDVVELLG